MTVAELIEHLRSLPQGSPVVYRFHSDYSELESVQVSMDQLIRRHDHWMDFRANQWDYATDGEPVLIDVCHFPGN